MLVDPVCPIPDFTDEYPVESAGDFVNKNGPREGALAGADRRDRP